MIRTQINIREGDKIDISYSKTTGRYYIDIEGEKGEIISISVPSLRKLGELEFAIDAYTQEKLREKQEELKQEVEDLIEIS